jgi:para-nitrobenzyl esterase
VPFVFDNVEVAPITRTQPERTRLAAQMSTAWINFARSGDPGHSGLHEWPAYGPADRAMMLFDMDSRVADDPDGTEREAWTAFD